MPDDILKLPSITGIDPTVLTNMILSIKITKNVKKSGKLCSMEQSFLLKFIVLYLQ